MNGEAKVEMNADVEMEMNVETKVGMNAKVEEVESWKSQIHKLIEATKWLEQ